MLGGLLLLLLLALQTASANPAARAGLAAAARGLVAAATTPRLTEPGRAVVLHTQFGQIRIRLLEQLAPRITALVSGRNPVFPWAGIRAVQHALRVRYPPCSRACRFGSSLAREAARAPTHAPFIGETQLLCLKPCPNTGVRT